MTTKKPGSDPSFDFAVDTLLRSAENDRPPPASLGKTAALLGVSVAPLATSSAASAAGLGGSAAKVAAGSNAAASSVATATATHAGFLGLGVGVGKVATVSALIVGGLGVTLSQTWEDAAEPAVARVAPSTSPGEEEESALPPVARAPKNAAPQLAPKEDLPASPEPQVKAPMVSSARGSIEATKAPPSLSQGGDSLERELKFLSFARAALQRGDGAGCLSAIDEYRSEFPSGALSVEAAVLRVEALLITSGREAARREAEALREQMPHSMHLKRFVALGLLDPDTQRDQ